MKADPFNLFFWKVTAPLTNVLFVIGLMILITGDTQPTNRQLAGMILGALVILRINIEANIRIWTAKVVEDLRQ